MLFGIIVVGAVGILAQDGADGETLKSKIQTNCWELAAQKQELRKSYVIREISATSLEECLYECENAVFTCQTVAYAPKIRHTNKTCHLSDWDIGSLDLRGHTDSVPNPDFNIYGKRQDFTDKSRPTEPLLCDSLSSESYLLPDKSADKNIFTVSAPGTLHLHDVCFARSGLSRRLSSRFVRKSHDVTNLEACQLLCARETAFDCKGFNFKKPTNSSVSVCELTTDNSRSIDVSSAFAYVEDSNTVFYEKVGQGAECDKYGGADHVNTHEPTNRDHWNYGPKPILSGTNGCFQKIKANHKLSDFITRQTLLVRSQIECEQECLDSKRFSCQLFSFSYSPSSSTKLFWPKNKHNCYLSDKDPKSLDVWRDIIWDTNSDIFEKSSLTCYGYSYWDKTYATTTKSYSSDTAKCFKKTRAGIRIIPRLIKKTTRVRLPVDCEEECLHSKSFICRSFAYRYFGSGNGYTDNCELTDIDVGSSALYLIEDRDYDTWHRTEFSKDCGGNGGYYDDTESITVDSCFYSYKSNSRIDTAAVKESISVRSLAHCEQECLKSRRYKCSSFSYRLSSRSGQLRGNCELSLWGATELERSRELIYAPDYNVYTRSTRHCAGYGDDNYGYNYGYSSYDSGDDVSASGVKCVRRCQENRKMGYWFCDTDDRGSWDYCCAPSSKCGYGQGQPIPWCFVGLSGRDQWRPCSERYAERPFAHLQSRAPENATAAISELTTELQEDQLPESGEETTTLGNRKPKSDDFPDEISSAGVDSGLLEVDKDLSTTLKPAVKRHIP